MTDIATGWYCPGCRSYHAPTSATCPAAATTMPDLPLPNPPQSFDAQPDLFTGIDPNVPPPKPTRPRAVADCLFGPVLVWLLAHTARSEGSLRSWLGGRAKTHGDAAVLEVVSMCAHAGRLGPAEPIAWCEARLKERMRHAAHSVDRDAYRSQMARWYDNEDRRRPGGRGDDGDGRATVVAFPTGGRVRASKP